MRLSRQHGKLIPAVAVLAVVALVIGVFIPGAGAEEIKVLSSPVDDGRATIREWTPERMMNAKPYPAGGRDGVPRRGLPAGMTSEPAQPVFIPGYPGDDEPAATETPGGDVPRVFGAAQGYEYPPPFTRYENFDRYRKFPYRAIGKLFFTQRGEDYVCSASSIGNFAVITAGHCVHYGDGQESSWSTDVVFVPAYKNGSAPYGQWPASKVLANDEWYNNGQGSGLRYDYGGAVLFRREGKKISQAVGNLGFAYNLDTNQHWFGFGYPAVAPFNGETMQICASSYAYSDTAFAAGPYPNGIGCDLTGGVSGGPWIVGFRGGNFVNGVTSYRYLGFNDELYSSYFNAAANTFYETLTTTRP